MVKPLKVAGEVDSWCTKCRMLLNHRIVSMDKGRPYQVLCLTCHTQHLYRANAPGQVAAPAVGRSSGVGATASTRTSDRPPRSHGPTRAEQARLDRERSWEKAVAGRSLGEFKPYNVTARFNEGDLIRHKKFGEGVVTRVIDAAKVEVLFRDEPRMLAHGMVG
jgi:hypothetical protein